MNCQEFWETMPELTDRGGDAPEHARQCPACAALLRRHADLRGGLQAMAAEWRSVEAPRRVESRLAGAFRGYNGLGGPARRKGWTPLVAWAAALAAVLVLGLFLVRGRQPQPAARRSPARVQLAVLEPAAPSAVSGSAFSPENGFLALPDADLSDAGDGVDVVRLELPRSSMIALGYAVSADRAAEPVEAEVVLGSNGLARAVRFLDND